MMITLIYGHPWPYLSLTIFCDHPIFPPGSFVLHVAIITSTKKGLHASEHAHFKSKSTRLSNNKWQDTSLGFLQSQLISPMTDMILITG